MREEGIEPTTAGTGIQRSTTELFPHGDPYPCDKIHSLIQSVFKTNPWYTHLILLAYYTVHTTISLKLW